MFSIKKLYFGNQEQFRKAYKVFLGNFSILITLFFHFFLNFYDIVLFFMKKAKYNDNLIF